MAEFLQHMVNGLIIGGSYALIGVGLTLIFGIMYVVNFAHGEFYMLGAFFLYTFFALKGINFLLASVLAILGVAVVGAAVERVLLRPLRAEPLNIPMLAMVGLSVLLQNAAMLIWQPDPKTIPPPFGTTPLSIGPIHFTMIRVFAAAVAVVIIVGAHLFIRRTTLGKAMRATFQDREMAELVGVSIDRIYTFTFAFGSALAASAGVLLGSIFWVAPSMGDMAALKAFAVVIMGGLGNFIGAICGGLLLGVAESLGAGYVSSGYKDGIGFLMIILLLLLRPGGLFARKERVA